MEELDFIAIGHKFASFCRKYLIIDVFFIFDFFLELSQFLDVILKLNLVHFSKYRSSKHLRSLTLYL